MSKQAPRVVRDKWRMKKWYEVVAPPVFGSIVLGTTPADDPRKLIGRVLETTLYDITGDFSMVHVHLYFQIINTDPENLKAYTRFKGHELARDYMKSLVRRKSSKIQGVYNVVTKDGYGLRITGVALTTYKCKTSQKSAIRKIMGEIITKRSSELSLDELVKTMLFGQLANEIFEHAKKIYPLRKVEIYKSKLLTVPGPEGRLLPAVVTPPLTLETR